METVGQVCEILSGYPKLDAIKMDVIGVGAGVADQLRELGYPVVDVNVGAASCDKNAYRNLRCELWWDLLETAREGTIAGAIDQRT